MICPNCGSTYVQKKGKRAGKQRYKCNDCKACFTEGTKYCPAKPYEKLEDIKCPNCGSTKIRRDGVLPSGNQRYECSDCHLNFSKATYSAPPPLPPEWKCPHCGGHLRRSGHGKLGQPEYYCTDCGKSCSGSIRTGKPLSHKRALSQVKRKRAKDKEQQFELKKQQLIRSAFSGMNLRNLSKTFNLKMHEIEEIMKDYYPQEKITKEQEKLIVRFGVYLNVHPRDIAPYAHCSEHKCAYIINKYKALLYKRNLMLQH